MSDKNTFTIGEFMQISGTSIRTLRYYDNIDLLKPSDYTEGGHRLYSKENLDRLQKIKSLQFLGFSLKDIKTMLQSNVANGADLLKSLNDRKLIFEAKKREIIEISSDLDHLIEVVEDEEIININIFCAMLQKLMLEEDTKKWFGDHFSKEMVDDLFRISKEEEMDLDKKWMNVLSDIKHLTCTGAIPASKEAQRAIGSLIECMNETVKGNLDEIVEKLPSTETFSVPSFFTDEEQAFLKEAMEIYQKDSGSKGR